MDNQNLTKNINNLTRLLGADRLLSPQDVTEILTGIMQILAEYKKGTESINEDTKQVVNILLEQIIKYNNETMGKTVTDFKTEAEKAHNERLKELETLLKDIKTMVLDVEVLASNVKDGKDADEEKIVENVVSRIKVDPTVITISAEEVRDKLTSLKEEDRLDKTAIKGLEKILIQKDLDYAIATLQQQTSFLINKGGLKTVSHDASLSGDGTPENPLVVQSTSGLTLKTNGTDNGSQTILNLKQGTNVTITDDGVGGVTINSTGGSGSPGGSNTQLQYNNSGSFGGISGATTDGTATTYTTGNLKAADVKASGSGGLQVLSNNGTVTSLHGSGGGANNTFYGGIKGDYLTASEILITDASKNIVSAPVATYPSLTELSYVKGLTSAIQTQLDGKVDENVAITGATKTKITYDAKGLVTAGADATTADIADSTNKRYVTDAQLTVIGNTSGTNTGDVTVTDSSEIDFTLTGQNITASLKSGSVDEAKLDTSVNASLDLADTSVQPNSSPTLGTITTTGNIELGNASDTTLSRSSAGVLAVEGVVIPSISSTSTLTNKTLEAVKIDYVIEPASDDTYEGESTNDLNAGDTIAQWDLVYLDSTSGRWEFADADASATSGGVLLALASASGTDGNALNVVFRGVVRNDGWTWTGAGKTLYVSTTAGGMTETAPSGTSDVVRVVGYTLSDDAIYFNPDNAWVVRT